MPVTEQIITLERERTLGNGELSGFLASPDEKVVVRTELALGRTKQVEAVTFLEQRLSDPRAAVRAMSVYALGLVADGAGAEQIVALLANDSFSAVRVAATDALRRDERARRLGREENSGEAALVTALGKDPDPIVRGRAATALASFSTGPAANAAAAALVASMNGERNNDVRQHVMWSVYRAYATQVPMAFLAKGLHDNDEIVRIEAVRAFGKLKNASAIAALQPLVNDPSWRVSEQASESLRLLHGQAMTAHLTALPHVQLPPLQPDRLASLPALPRTPETGKPAAPNASQAILEPSIDPVTARDMTGPAHGPHPRLRIVTTKGNVYVTLFPEWAPLTTANFLNLANRGYYDGNRWFRIVPDFVVQTGDPHDNGDGDAGYSIPAEENPLEQRSYVISMGLNYDDKTQTPIRDSAGTQYYVTLSPQYHLDSDFTVFGWVTSGTDVLARLIESDRVVRVERVADETL